MSERDEGRQKRIDLSVPQVAGGAVAAVVAAKLASYFGVYGTILGAGVVSVVATCGGSVFQHFFKRTGEQIRDVTVAAPPTPEQKPPAPGEFTEGTVYRARVKSWKRPLVAAALVFGITMVGITGYELASGTTLGGDKGTSVSGALSGGGSSSKSDDGDDEPSSTSSATPSQESTDGGATPSDSTSPSAEESEEAEDGSGTTPSATATPTPTESGSATSPTPDASSRSGTGDQDQADPAEQ